MKETTLSDYLSSADELIEEARAGRMFILVDDEDRENEGDLVIPAQFATPEAVNFMARHARGLICLAMTRHRVEQLGLSLMSQSNGSRHQTAFTVSIEAAEGVTTGISAHDRAHTIAVAINPESGAKDIVTPGHVFPLMAREGGTLVRAGHTEAAVDIARLAGLNTTEWMPSAPTRMSAVALLPSAKCAVTEPASCSRRASRLPYSVLMSRRAASPCTAANRSRRLKLVVSWAPGRGRPVVTVPNGRPPRP
jgi:3,4-dihydroxy-2-butanone 4-phosphate synthase